MGNGTLYSTQLFELSPINEVHAPARRVRNDDNADHIRELLLQIRDTEQRLARLRAELRRLVAKESGEASPDI